MYTIYTLYNDNDIYNETIVAMNNNIRNNDLYMIPLSSNKLNTQSSYNETL